MTSEPAPPSARDARKTSPERLLAFSDAVYAIIITILVLDLEVPDVSDGSSLGDGLAELVDTLTAFVISFLLVGMYWARHRSLFTHVRHVTWDVVWLNLLLLLPTSLIPFAASVLGEYPEDATALHVYGAVLVATGLMSWVMTRYLFRHPGLLWDSVTTKGRRVAGLIAGAPVLVYAVAMLVASWQPAVSVLIYLAVPALYLGGMALLKRGSRTSVATQEVD